MILALMPHPTHYVVARVTCYYVTCHVLLPHVSRATTPHVTCYYSTCQVLMYNVSIYSIYHKPLQSARGCLIYRTLCSRYLTMYPPTISENHSRAPSGPLCQ